jgi:hypothetical protein
MCIIETICRADMGEGDNIEFGLPAFELDHP